MVFDKMKIGDFEQVIYCHDSSVGLKAIIGLHSLVLGPATGGCRMWDYSTEADALEDVLRLSEGMTYKASLAGLNWGGGKAVIMGDPKNGKTPELLRRFGEFVDRLGGDYITAKDVGIGGPDLKIIHQATSHVLGIEGEKGSSGDPSPATALGVYAGLQACAQHVFGTQSLKGVRIALQGLGSVSYYLLKYLVSEGAIVIGCDIDPKSVERAVQEFGIDIVQPETIYDVPCDIFAPAALGGSINEMTLPRLRAKIIAGPANNQLASVHQGDELFKRGMVYAPDYAINAGGLINIYYESPLRGGYQQEKAYSHVRQIGGTIREILERAQAEKKPTYLVANKMAEERIIRKRKSK